MLLIDLARHRRIAGCGRERWERGWEQEEDIPWRRRKQGRATHAPTLRCG